MNLLAFLRPKPSTAGQVLAAERERQDKLRKRARVDAMRRQLGLPPYPWRPL